MKQIKSKLVDAQRTIRNDGVILAQQIIEGPENLLDRVISLNLTTQEAKDLVIKLIWELLPWTESESILKRSKRC